MAHLLIAEARFYAHLNDMLLAGARAAIEAAGHSHETITVTGALELPAAVALASESGRFDAFVALGVVVRGETWHFEIVAGESARGLMALTLDGLAIGNGILTCDTDEQALDRAGLPGSSEDKGYEAAQAALVTADTLRGIRTAPAAPPATQADSGPPATPAASGPAATTPAEAR